MLHEGGVTLVTKRKHTRFRRFVFSDDYGGYSRVASPKWLETIEGIQSQPCSHHCGTHQTKLETRETDIYKSIHTHWNLFIPENARNPDSCSAAELCSSNIETGDPPPPSSLWLILTNPILSVCSVLSLYLILVCKSWPL